MRSFILYLNNDYRNIHCDVNGIGVEVILKALQSKKWPDDVSFQTGMQKSC